MKHLDRSGKLFTLIVFLLTGLLFSCNSTPTDSTSTTWVKAYSTANGNGNKTSAVQVKDGGYIVSGHTSVVKLDITGKIVWQRQFLYTGNYIFPNAIATTPDEGIIVSDRLYEPTGQRNGALILIKLDKNGDTLWQKLYYDQSDELESLYALSIDGASGMIYVTGTIGDQRYIRKIAADGALLWTKKIGTAEDFGYTNIIQALSGGGCVIGTRSSTLRMITKMDAGGSIEWQKCYRATGVPDNPGNAEGDTMRSIEATKDGGYIVLGNTENVPWVLKLDVEGNKAWAKMLSGFIQELKYPGTIRNNVKYTLENSIHHTDDGGYALSGQSSYYRSYIVSLLNYVEFNDHAAWIIKLNANGSISWQKNYRDRKTSKTYLASNDDEYGNAYVTSYWNSINLTSFNPCSNGGYIVAGTTELYGPEGTNWLVFVTDKDGMIQNTEMEISDMSATASAIDFIIETVPEESADAETMVSDFMTTVETPAFTVTDI